MEPFHLRNLPLLYFMYRSIRNFDLIVNIVLDLTVDKSVG